jgi:5-(carboxyamino)imidazole ribonucleotide mutase
VHTHIQRHTPKTNKKIRADNTPYTMPKVAIIAGSKSDQELSDKAAQTLKELDITHEQQIISAHRSPDKLTQYVKGSDAQVYICIAGLSAALPGAVASHTTKPVIGVPKDAKLLGLDSLLSIAQMPPGVPVATVGIDNARNAALLAAEILALGDPELAEKLRAQREEQAKA